MTIPQLLFLIIAAIIAALFAAFAITSARERKPRAAAISLMALVLIAAATLLLSFLPFTPIVLWLLIAAAALLAILFFAPIHPGTPLRIGYITERVDERDTMFAREEYQPGTPKYEAHYQAHPELKSIDDKIRRLPAILSPGGRYYDEPRARKVRAIFNTIASMTTHVDDPIAGGGVRLASPDPAAMTTQIKDLVLRLGADEVGVAELNPMFVYSHVGRGPEPWGSPIENTHRYAIAFALEMDYFAVETAPRMPAVEETAAQYLRAAHISVSLARIIRSLGFPARAHISDSNYQIMLPPVAHAAGLGELGRHGYLISPHFGSRIRLGAVTTDLPLLPDHPITFGVQEFCAICRKCADNCPPRAIPFGKPTTTSTNKTISPTGADGKTNVRGVEKWLLNTERCLHYWRTIGTDCGLCMRVCPFSHPATPVHDLIRLGIKNSPVARRLSLWGDDLLYGRRV